MIFVIYQILISFIILISPIIIIVRIIKNKEDKKRFLEKFSITNKKSFEKDVIWFHAASVGEVISIISIIKYFEKKKEIKKILITTNTLSSSKIVKQLKLKKIIHQFYPIDHNIITIKFLNHWKPKIAFFLESEIWPSMFLQLYKKKIPLVLLNARLTKKSFNRWMYVEKFAKKIFALIKHVYPQNKETKDFLKKLNIREYKQIGNLKYIDYNFDEKTSLRSQILKKLKKYKIWVAASTHPGEEYLAAKTHILLKQKHKNLITIIIPRHMHDIKNIVEKLENLDLVVVRHSFKKKNITNIDIYIVDTFGESKYFYEISPTVFLGKSIFHNGGQNPLEAARLGCNILHGPNIENFKDVYKHLKDLKISKKINSIDALASNIKFKKNYSNSIRMKSISQKIYKETLNELNHLIK